VVLIDAHYTTRHATKRGSRTILAFFLASPHLFAGRRNLGQKRWRVPFALRILPP
jgi:hypothetical protein